LANPTKINKINAYYRENPLKDIALGSLASSHSSGRGDERSAKGSMVNVCGDLIWIITFIGGGNCQDISKLIHIPFLI